MRAITWRLFPFFVCLILLATSEEQLHTEGLKFVSLHNPFLVFTSQFRRFKATFRQLAAPVIIKRSTSFPEMWLRGIENFKPGFMNDFPRISAVIGVIFEFAF